MLWLWIVLGVLALLCLACLAAAWVSVESVVKPHRHTVESMRAQEVGNGFLDAIEPYERDWKRVSFELPSNGVTLSGEYVVNPLDSGARHKVAVIAHGHTVNRYAALKYADIFYRAGFSILIYDERYFGQSTGAYCTLGQEEAKDLRNVLAYTREVFGQDCVIGLHGESMGAATVLLVLEWEKPDFVVADCPFADSHMLFADILHRQHLPAAPVLFFADVVGRLRYGYCPDKVSPMKAVEKADVPICFMHGTADSLISCAHSQRMIALCRDKRSVLHLYEGAEHASSIIVDRKGYEEKLLAFVRSCVAG